MNARLLFRLGISLVAFGAPTADAAQVYETSAGFFTSGDFVGNGLADVLLADKATGNIRVGYQAADGTLAWTGPIPSGAATLSGLAVGRFFNSGFDAPSVAAAEFNHVALLDLSDPGNPGSPISCDTGGPGPYFLSAITGAAPGAPDWVVAGSQATDPGRTLLELSSFLGASLMPQQTTEAGSPLARGNALQLGADPATMPVAIQRDTNDQFLVFARADLSPLLALPGLPPGSDYAFGRFNREDLPRFLFYVPGASNLVVQSLLATNGVYQFDSGLPVETGEPLQSVVYSEDVGDGIAILVFADGVQGLTLMNGVPVLTEVYRSGTGQPGNVFSGVAPLGGNRHLVALDGPAGSAPSHAQVLSFDGAHFTLLSDAALPPTTSASTRANVWLFQAEPFVSETPNLIASMTVPGWSTGVEGLPGSLAVAAASDGGPASGLGTPATNSLGAPPPAAAFALPDQYREFISIFSYAGARPTDAALVKISPPPGLYGGPIQVSFSTLAPADQVYYRAGVGDGWHAFGNPFTLTNDASVQYYGVNSGGTRSSLLAAAYTFGRSGGAPEAPFDFSPGTTNPPPVIPTNSVVLSEVGTVFYGRRSAATNNPVFLGPKPYLSFAGNSPFANLDFRYFYLETFEEGAFTAPGATASPGWVVTPPGPWTDSVDADDGVIDGSGAGGHSYYSGGNHSALTITFDAAALGGHLPTHAGMVWTDVGAVTSGVFGFGEVVFSALDARGNPLGSLTGTNLGNGSAYGSGNGATSEDRFFGVVNPAGISSITIAMLNSADWEVDHLQYGYADPAGDQGSIWAINLDGTGEAFVTPGARPRVSPDGRYMAFLREGSPFDNLGNLWLRDLVTGQEARFLENTNTIVGYSWDLGGTNLVLDFGCGLYRLDLSRNLTALPLPALCNDAAPAVNPVDGRLAFHNLGMVQEGLYTTPLDRASRALLPVSVMLPRWAAWSPDGSELAVADGANDGSQDGGRNLWIVGANGTNLAQISAFPYYDLTNGFPHGAIWSPPGDALIAAGTVFGTNGLWVIPLTTAHDACDCPPILLPTSPGGPIDFAGSVVVAPAAPLVGHGPKLFIRLDPQAVVVYWTTNSTGYTLEATDDLSAGVWTAVPLPYATNSGFFEHAEPFNALPPHRYFHLRHF